MGDPGPLQRSRAQASLRWAPWLLLAVVLGTALTAGAARWTVADGDALQAVARQIQASTGLTVVTTGSASFRLLPRPTIELRDVSFRARDGTVQADAERLKGGLDLAALATGQVRLVSAALERPTVTLDLDRIRALVEPLLTGEPARLAGLLRTGGLSLHDGVIRLMSVDPVADALLTDVSATLAWPAEGAGASVVGRATVRGIAFSAALDLDTPDDLLRGGASLGSLHLKSDPLDLQVIATLSASAGRLATGRIEASTADLRAFLRLIDHPAPQLSGIGRAHLDGVLSVGGGALSISDVALGLDDMQFEGALAVRRKGDRPALAATLATDRIDLNRFLGELPAFTAADGRWTDRMLDTRAIADDDIDLRVSAARAVLGPFRIDDSSLSLQSGEGRLELSVGEARAYDGLLKARIVARVDGAVTSARIDAALSRLDLGKLLRDAKEPRCSGILTGNLGIEATGSSPAALAGAAQGRGELTLRDGQLDPSVLQALLSRVATAPVAVAEDLGPAFDDVAARFRVGQGQIVLGDSWVAWPTARAVLSGMASLPDQRLDLRAVVSPSAPEGDSLAYEIGGPWRDLHLIPARPPT